MTQIKLTSVQEAAFNAAAEAAKDLGVPFAMDFKADGTVSAYGYVGGNSNNAMAHTWKKPTGAAAVQGFLDELEKELAKPQLIRDPAEVKKAALALVDEIRDRPIPNAPELDELADRIAALPVKE